MIEPHPTVARIERRTKWMAWALLALTFVPAGLLLLAAIWSLR